MVSFRPLRIGLWDPFQMADTWLIHGGDPNRSTNWDDPPTTILHPPPKSFKKMLTWQFFVPFWGW